MGFHRTVLLKRAARFFFYCQKIIKVFLTIRVMPHRIEKKAVKKCGLHRASSQLFGSIPERHINPYWKTVPPPW